MAKCSKHAGRGRAPKDCPDCHTIKTPAQAPTVLPKITAGPIVSKSMRRKPIQGKFTHIHPHPCVYCGRAADIAIGGKPTCVFCRIGER